MKNLIHFSETSLLFTFGETLFQSNRGLKSHIKAIQSWQRDQNRADSEIVGSDHLQSVE